MIRRLQLRDSAGVKRLKSEEIGLLGLPSAMAAFSPLMAALASESPSPVRKWHTYVYVEDGRMAALAQARMRTRRDEWDVVYLSSAYCQASGHNPTNPQIWSRLLEYLSRDAASQGVRRIYASLTMGAGDPQIFFDAGFHCYTKEHQFGTQRRPEASLPLEVVVRPQQRSDAWAIHQLYNSNTPSMVRQVESLTSDSWQLPMRLPFLLAREAGYVLEYHHGMVGYIHIESIAGWRVIRLLFRPEIRSLLGPVLGTVLAVLKPSTKDPVCCSLREHQLELATTLEEQGFSFVGTQLHFVRHTTSVVKVIHTQRVPTASNRRTATNPTAHVRGTNPSR